MGPKILDDRVRGEMHGISVLAQQGALLQPFLKSLIKGKPCIMVDLITLGKRSTVFVVDRHLALKARAFATPNLLGALLAILYNTTKKK